MHRLAELSAAILPTLQRTISGARAGSALSARGQQYGGPTFETASEFLRIGTRGNIRELRPTEAAKGIVAAATVMSRLPRASIRLTDSVGGEAIRSYLTARRLGVPTHRVAQGVLVMPESIEAYLRGRRRQAVRTNIRRARATGTSCRRLAGDAERRQYADLFDPDRSDNWKRAQFLTRPEADCWIALDAAGRPVGFASCTVDDEVAMLWSLASREHPARWLLHTEIVDQLITRGVRHLMVGAKMAPLLSPEIQHFQHLLGYRVTHVLLRR